METNRPVILEATPGNYIALDKSSGGYPYLVSSVWEAEIFRNRKVAAAYVRMFPNGGGDIAGYPWNPLNVYITTDRAPEFNPIELGKEVNPDTALGQFVKMLESASIEFDLECLTGGAFTITYTMPNKVESTYIFTANGDLSAVSHV